VYISIQPGGAYLTYIFSRAAGWAVVFFLLFFIGTFFDRHNIFFYSPYPAWKRVRTGQTLAHAGVKNKKRKKVELYSLRMLNERGISTRLVPPASSSNAALLSLVLYKMIWPIPYTQHTQTTKRFPSFFFLYYFANLFLSRIFISSRFFSRAAAPFVLL
jgi:hypothetical protein